MIRKNSVVKIQNHFMNQKLPPVELKPDCDTAFWILNPKSIFGQISVKKVKIVHFDWNWYTEYLKDAGSYSHISFSISNPKSILGKFGLKESKLFVLPENCLTESLEYVDSYCNIGFLNFQY